MMVSFVNTGDWFKESGVKPLEKCIPPYSYNCVLNILFWALFTLIPAIYFSYKILISGNLFHIILLTIPTVLGKFSFTYVMHGNILNYI